MDGSLTDSLVLLLVTASPLVLLGIILWRRQKEFHEEMRLRRSRTMGVRK